jgi:hypothetical protein
MRIRFDAKVLGWVVQHMNCELKKLCNNIGSRKIKITTLFFLIKENFNVSVFLQALHPFQQSILSGSLNQLPASQKKIWT